MLARTAARLQPASCRKCCHFCTDEKQGDPYKRLEEVAGPKDGTDGRCSRSEKRLYEEWRADVVPKFHIRCRLAPEIQRFLTGHGRPSHFVSVRVMSRKSRGASGRRLGMTKPSHGAAGGQDKQGSRVPTGQEPLSAPLLTTPAGSFKSANSSADVFTR